MKPQNISVNHAPGEAYQLKYRFWQGCPSILRTPGGRLFAAWYSGGNRRTFRGELQSPDPE